MHALGNRDVAAAAVVAGLAPAVLLVLDVLPLPHLGEEGGLRREGLPRGEGGGKEEDQEEGREGRG